MTLTDLLAVAKKMIEDGTTRGEVFEFLDDKASKDPALQGAVTWLKGVLIPLFDQGHVSDSFTKAVAEALSLWKNKYGPVSDAPEIGLA